MGRKVILQPGQKFGKWTVIEAAGHNKDHRALWKCQCECGTIKNVVGRDLRNGSSKSCGCKHIYKQPHFIDLTGQKFGRLTVKRPVESNTRGLKRWECLCDCGTTIIVTGNDLRTGHTSSCGCLRSKGEEVIGKLLQQHNIIFEKEKSFESCISDSRQARFDFFVDNKYLIEFDGIQHFQEDQFSHTKLEDVQRRDANKNLWCKQNNMPLIRIPYWHLASLTIEDLLLDSSSFLIERNDDLSIQ